MLSLYLRMGGNCAWTKNGNTPLYETFTGKMGENGAYKLTWWACEGPVNINLLD